MFEMPAPADTAALEKAAARMRKDDLRVQREAQRREQDSHPAPKSIRRGSTPRPYRFRSPPGRR